MNNPRRKQISDVQTLLVDARKKLESILDDEDSYLNNMPESLFTSSEKSAVAQENISDLQYSIDNIEDVISTLAQVIERKHV